MLVDLRVGLAVVVLACLSSADSTAKDRSAEALLREVSNAYASVERFRFEATETTETRSGDLERRTENRVITVADGSGCFRVESDHSTDGGIVAFDGEATWVYLARRNQYQKIKGAMLDGPESPALLRLKNRFTSRYGDITKRLRSATFKPPESLQINGRQQKCRVVEATYDAPRGLAAEQIVRRYWIDQDRPLIYQERSEFQARNPASGRTTSVLQEVVFHQAHIDEAIQEDVLAPSLPEGAELVVSFEDADSSPVGRPAPPFEATDLDGIVHRAVDWKGKVVLLDFWASWCTPCRIDLPRIEALHHEFSGRGFIVLGVNDEAPDKARAFLRDNDLSFPTLADQGSELFRAFEVRTIPTAVIIGRDGKICSFLVGSHSEEELRKAVNEAGID